MKKKVKPPNLPDHLSALQPDADKLRKKIDAARADFLHECSRKLNEDAAEIFMAHAKVTFQICIHELKIKAETWAKENKKPSKKTVGGFVDGLIKSTVFEPDPGVPVPLWKAKNKEELCAWLCRVASGEKRVKPTTAELARTFAGRINDTWLSEAAVQKVINPAHKGHFLYTAWTGKIPPR